MQPIPKRIEALPWVNKDAAGAFFTVVVAFFLGTLSSFFPVSLSSFLEEADLRVADFVMIKMQQSTLS